MRRTRTTALAALALLNVFTLAAGLAVAHMLPPRLARLHVPVAAARPVVNATPVLAPVGTLATRVQATASPTASGLAAMLGAALPSAATGSGVGIEVADAGTGQVLYSANAGTPATPASTTKVVTAVAALAALGPDARFTTTVRQVGGTVVLVGGGDPTLAVNEYPSSDYPRPATLAQLAAGTARALKAQGRHSVRLGYDTALFSGPDMAQGWTDSDISTGNVTPIVALEADQGRLTPGGALEDDDDPVNFRPRTTDPVGMTVAAFAALLARDGITVTGTPAETAAPASAPVLASVSSPPLVAIAEQMLQESNNVIAENLARHVAIALGMPATFSGAAGADMAELRRLGITTPISLVDGSGLSPAGRDSAGDADPRAHARREHAEAARGHHGASRGRLQRHALGRRQRLRRDRRDRRRDGARGRAGQDRQPGHGRDARGARVRPFRRPAALRDHGTAGAKRGPAAAGRRRDRRGGRRPGHVRVFVSMGTPTTISEHVR